MKHANIKDLLSLKNVGKATLRDLKLLEITSIKQLSESDPDDLYIRLQQITGTKHDPCAWDVFAAIIHEARTGEKMPWWQWTPERKKRQQSGTFCL